jgi:hypothetical protein
MPCGLQPRRRAGFNGGIVVYVARRLSQRMSLAPPSTRNAPIAPPTPMAKVFATTAKAAVASVEAGSKVSPPFIG